MSHDNTIDPLTCRVRTTGDEPGAFMRGGGKCQPRKTRAHANYSPGSAQPTVFRPSLARLQAAQGVCMFIMGRLLGVSSVLFTASTSGRNV